MSHGIEIAIDDPGGAGAPGWYEARRGVVVGDRVFEEDGRTVRGGGVG